MTSAALVRTIDELIDLRDHLRESAERELGSNPDLLRLHLAALRTVPDRIAKAVGDYIRTSALPIQLKPQDLLDLWRRSAFAVVAVGIANCAARGETLENAPMLSAAARYVLPELSKQVEDGNRASVLRWLLIDFYDQIPNAFHDAAIAEFWKDFENRS